MNSNRVWGGGEKWHYETACFFDQQGYSVIVITNRRSDLYYRLKGQKDILVISKRVSNFSFFNPFKLNYFRKLFKIHHVHSVFLGLSNDVKLGGLAARMAGVEQIIYRRGSAIPVNNSFFNRFLFQHVLTRIITNSEEIRNTLFQRNPEIINTSKVHTIYNGINLANWPAPDFFMNGKDRPTQLILGNAGRLVEQKGQDYLISIAGLLKEHRIDFKLLIAGRGDLEKSLKRRCIKENLREEVVFLDFVDDIKEFLKGLDMYLSTSIHEGSSHVILEAMAAGKPVLAFDISSMPEMIVDGDSGYLVPFGDVEQYAEKIIQLWADKKALVRMGKNARVQVEKKFDFNTNVKKVIELIEK
ncbi:MAG: glycosyltransferase family 4 protein [Bacteroidales bacterium]